MCIRDRCWVGLFTRLPAACGEAKKAAHPPLGTYVLFGELDLRDVDLGLVLHREPTGWGEHKPSALTVEDCQDSARIDLIARRLAGIERRDAARKNSEISHAQSLT